MNKEYLLNTLNKYKDKISVEDFNIIERKILSGELNLMSAVHQEGIKAEQQGKPMFIPSFDINVGDETKTDIYNDKIKAPESQPQPQEQTHIQTNKPNETNESIDDIDNNIIEDNNIQDNTQTVKDEIKKEAQEQKEQQEQRQKETLEELTPKKGQVTNENYDLPINTHPDNMTSKNVDYDLIGALTLKSKFGGTFINSDGERYFYKNDLDYTKLAEVIGKSEATVKRLINKLIKSDTNIVTVSNSKNGIYYTLNCKTDNKYYVLINHKQLYQMLTSFRPDMIKLYITLKLKCNYEITVNGHKGALKLSNEYIGAKMGYKITNGTISGATQTKITSMTNTLETMGYITKTLKYETMWDEKKQKEITKKRNHYTICTYEEWAIKNPREAKLKQDKETGEYYFSEDVE